MVRLSWTCHVRDMAAAAIAVGSSIPSVGTRSTAAAIAATRVSPRARGLLHRESTCSSSCYSFSVLPASLGPSSLASSSLDLQLQRPSSSSLQRLIVNRHNQQLVVRPEIGSVHQLAPRLLSSASHLLPSSSSSLLLLLPSSRSRGIGGTMGVTAEEASRGPSSSHPVKAVLTADVGLTKPAETILPGIAITATEGEAAKWKGDLLAVGVFQGDSTGSGKLESLGLKALDGVLGGILGDIVTEEDFAGKAGQSSSARVSGYGFKRLAIIGLGKPEAATSSFKPWKSLGESVAGVAKPAQAKSAAILIANPPQLSSEAKLGAASALASGTVLGVFEDVRFKSEAKKPTLEKVEILGLGSGAELEAKLSEAVKVAAGVIFARQLVNAPPNVLIPSVLADQAENLAAEFSDVLTAKILDEDACKELKMGSYLGVAIASSNPPKFIHLQYKPPGGNVKTKLAIVGKGLTFDSGGYNLKTGPGSMIELMKFDMGGAAAAIGAAKAIAAIKPPGVEVNFIVAACENMISGGGMRPGDILTASNGKTIEVNNTDAEGRLTLADALVYASNLKVDKIVDLATLTGACIIALGNDIAGVFTPNDDLAAELSIASHSAGERLWRMPMEDAYWEMMKSGIADMVNTGGRPGGSITAALFLKQFVDDKIAWAHIDLAGPVWSNEKKSATGFAVATLFNWVLKQSSA